MLLALRFIGAIALGWLAMSVVGGFLYGVVAGFCKARARRRVDPDGDVSCRCSLSWMLAFMKPAPWCAAETHPFVIRISGFHWTRLHGGRVVVPPKGVALDIVGVPGELDEEDAA